MFFYNSVRISVVVCFAFMVLSSSVFGHGNILYGIELDFDTDLRDGVVSAAQEYFGTDEEPVEFDLDHELIKVKFTQPDPDKAAFEKSVSIFPDGFVVYGFRDDTLVQSEKEVFDSEARRGIAQGVFDTIPDHLKEELRYGEERVTYVGTFMHTWYRYVDGVLIADDVLEVEVDGESGDVVSWRVTPFFRPASALRTKPAISYEVADAIALVELNADPLEFDPVLIMERGVPVWITKVKSLYPAFVGVNGLTGRVLFSGPVRTTLPDGYDYGREVEIVVTDRINGILGDAS